MENKYINYRHLNDKLSPYIKGFVWHGSIKDRIDNWLRKIYFFPKEYLICKGHEDNMEFGYYYEKDVILNKLHNTIPITNNDIEKSEVYATLNDIWDFIIDY